MLVSIAYRQTEGVVKAHARKVPSIPDYSTISRRVNKVDIIKIDKRIGNDIVIALDSTGIKVANRGGEWIRDKWHVRRGYLKIHVAVDIKKKRVVSLEVTSEEVILVSATDKILEQIDEGLGKFALEKLKESGVEFIMNTQVKGATKDKAILHGDTVIPCYSLIWTAGVTPNKLVANLQCEHDRGHRILANSYLEMQKYEGAVYALGDCASVTDPHTGKPYPPTAQHAIRQGKVGSKEHSF